MIQLGGFPETHAEKSAAAVADMFASAESRACHTAPLCPRKVPILILQRQHSIHLLVLEL